MEQWFLDIRQEDTRDHYPWEKVNKWVNYMTAWREFPGVVWGMGGPQKEPGGLLEFRRHSKSLWRSQQLEFSEQGRVLCRRKLHRERKLWRSTEGSFKSSTKYWSAKVCEETAWGQEKSTEKDQEEQSSEAVVHHYTSLSGKTYEAPTRELRRVLPQYHISSRLSN